MGKKSITMFVHKSDRTLRPISQDEFNLLIDDFQDMQKVTVTVENFVRPVERSQMNLLHVYLGYIREYTGDGIASIKKAMKEEYGVRNEDGRLKSTAEYSTVEMAQLIDGTYIHATQFLGIVIPEPEQWKNKNLR